MTTTVQTTAVQTNTVRTNTMNMREVFLTTIEHALDDDPRLVVVLADISAAQLRDATARHPDRVINLGIREQLLVSVGGGLALAGMRPVLHTFPSFLVERPFEQVKLDIGHQNVGAVLVSYGGSYDMSGLGRTHQSPADVALLDTLPGWRIHVPGHPDEARSLLLDALPGNDPVYLRLSGQTNSEAFPTGGAHVLRRGGSGVVLAIGPVLDAVLAGTEHADVTVLYTATARPFPARALHAAVVDTGRADVLLVEPYQVGTSAHAVSEALADTPHRLRSVGVRRESELRVYGSPADHEAAHGLDATGIATVLHRLTTP